MTATALAVAAALISILCSKTLIAWLQSHLTGSLDTYLGPKDRVDAVIVLGYALYWNGTATAPLQGRVLHGTRMWEDQMKLHGSCIMIFSGAHPGDGLRGRSEAAAMRQHALKVHGAATQPPQWLLEANSTSTRENAMFSLPMVSQRGLSSIVVVTNTFHQWRSYMVFLKAAQDLGLKLQVRLAHVPFVGHSAWGGGPVVDGLMDHVDFWRELAAIAWYKVKKYI